MFSPIPTILYILALLGGFYLAMKYIGPFQDRLSVWEKANAKRLKSPYNINGSHMFWTAPLFILIAALIFCLKDFFN